MESSTKILVTGATGNLGGAVVKSLLGKGLSVVAGTTHPINATIPVGAHIVKLDYEQPSIVEAALEGVDGLFLVAPPLDVAAPAKLTPVIDQAGKRGVRHIANVNLCNFRN